MKYMMNNLEQQVFDMIEQDGIKATMTVFIRALTEYSHSMSDLGIKERAYAAISAIDKINSIRKDIKD